MTRIVFIDDLQDELDPVRALLVKDAFTVERHSDGDFALSVLQRKLPDFVVMNLSASNAASLTLLERIRDKWIVPVVLLSSTRDEIDEIMALRFDADDFIHKPVSPRLLAERIKGLLRRSAILASFGQAPADTVKVLAQGDIVMDPSRHEVTWKEQPITLTVTEFRLLMSLVRRPGIVKNRDHLMSEVYTDEVYVDDRTIDSHIKRIRKKIRAVDQDFDSIETLYGVGYRFVMPSKARFLLRSVGTGPEKRLAA